MSICRQRSSRTDTHTTHHHDDLVVADISGVVHLSTAHSQHMPQSLLRERLIRIRQLCYPLHMIHAIDMRRHPRSGDIPVVILEFVKICQSDWNMPGLAFGRIRYR